MIATFSDGADVVNLRPGPNLTAGRRYRVLSSYEGYSGSGPQEWVRVVDDNGDVSAYDPERFIAALDPDSSDGLGGVLATLRLRQAVETLRGELGSAGQGGAFSPLRDALGDLLADINHLTATLAPPATTGVLTFFPVAQADQARHAEAPPSRFFWEIGVDARCIGVVRHDGTAYILHQGDRPAARLQAAHYAAMRVEVAAAVRSQAEVQGLSLIDYAENLLRRLAA